MPIFKNTHNRNVDVIKNVILIKKEKIIEKIQL